MGATNNTTLTWADNSGNETGFKLESGAERLVRSARYNSCPPNTTQVGNFTTPTNTLTLFRVRAYNAAGDSAFSAVASAPVAKIVSPVAGAGPSTSPRTSTSPPTRQTPKA